MCVRALPNPRRSHLWSLLPRTCTSTGLRPPGAIHTPVASSGFKYLLAGRRGRQHRLTSWSPEQGTARQPPEAGPRSLPTGQAAAAEGCSDGRRAVRVGARQRDREMPATLLTQQLWKHACPTSTRNKSRLTLENQRRQHSSGIRVKSENARRRRSCRDERRPLVSFLIQDEPVTFSEKPFGNMCR